jgi:hypothetical protein
MNNRSTHIPLPDLADMAEHRGATSVGHSASAHLQVCEECATTLQQLERAISLMTTDTAEDAPRDVLHRAIAAFQTRPQQPSLVKRILAVLSFDSFNVAPAFGTRSGHTGSRQLIYSADAADIDLHVEDHEDRWIISGQVLGISCDDGTVEIDGPGISLSGSFSAACEFKFPAVPSGDYQLRVRLSDVEVEVPRLELRK